MSLLIFFLVVVRIFEYIFDNQKKIFVSTYENSIVNYKNGNSIMHYAVINGDKSFIEFLGVFIKFKLTLQQTFLG